MIRLLAVLLLAAEAPASRPAAPLEREAALKQAAEAVAAGRRAEAARLLREIADRFHSVRALLLLARLEAGEKDWAGALREVEAARSLAPNSEDVLSAHAQVSLGAGRPVQAILALQSLARMCPSVAQHHYLLGVALLQAGDFPAAAESLRRAAELEPERALNLIALGLALNGLKRYDDATAPLRKSLELEPDSVEARAALAEADEARGDVAAAEENAARALARDPGSASANFVLGKLRMRQERYDEARDALSKALAADPSLARAHYQLSLAFARLGQPVQSEAHLRTYKDQIKDAEARVRQIRGEDVTPAGKRP